MPNGPFQMSVLSARRMSHAMENHLFGDFDKLAMKYGTNSGRAIIFFFFTLKSFSG